MTFSNQIFCIFFNIFQYDEMRKYWNLIELFVFSLIFKDFSCIEGQSAINLVDGIPSVKEFLNMTKFIESSALDWWDCWWFCSLWWDFIFVCSTMNLSAKRQRISINFGGIWWNACLRSTRIIRKIFNPSLVNWNTLVEIQF